MPAFLSRFGIRGRLLAGFATICLLLAATIAYTTLAVSDISKRTKQVVQLRTPVAIASTQLVGNLYSTLATLSAYLLTGDAQYKLSREATWIELDRTVAELDRLAEGFSDPANRAMWGQSKMLIAEFRAAQTKAETVAFTPEAYPATKMLLTEAAPLIGKMSGAITQMINEEDGLEATPQRKHLIKTLGDARDYLASARSQLRQFVMSGEKADREKFAPPLASFKAALGSIAE